jgi:hypothetical protein
MCGRQKGQFSLILQNMRRYRHLFSLVTFLDFELTNLLPLVNELLIGYQTFVIVAHLNLYPYQCLLSIDALLCFNLQLH